MLDEMPARTLAEWMAYDELEPIGGLRSDVQVAWTLMHTMQPHMRKGYRPKMTDFMPPYFRDQKPRKQTADEIKGVFDALRMRAKRGNGNSNNR